MTKVVRGGARGWVLSGKVRTAATEQRGPPPPLPSTGDRREAKSTQLSRFRVDAEHDGWQPMGTARLGLDPGSPDYVRQVMVFFTKSGIRYAGWQPADT